MPLFCRHNRLTADCPICSKGMPLDTRTSRPAKPAARREARRLRSEPTPDYRGPFAAAGPYQDDQGGLYEVRLERVPGGLRLAAWQAGSLRRQAPVLAAGDLAALIRDAARSGALEAEEAASLLRAVEAGGLGGVSRGRAGELRDELRVEALEGGRLRVARWVLRPGSGWELQQAPAMFPAARYAEALASGQAEAQRP